MATPEQGVGVPEMNVAFICVDCLRGDFARGLDAETPFLDEFLEASTRYTTMCSTATTTTPSVASFMTGYYSENNGVVSLRNADLAADVRTLAERYRVAGFHTAAHVTGPIVADTGLDRGFEEFRYREQERDLFTGWADDLTARVRSLDSPFFVYIHLWELHGPLEPPARFDRARYGPTRYERTLSALDGKLEALVDSFPENTVVVLHGDHGESITWRYSKTHGRRNLFQKAAKTIRDKLRYESGIDTRPFERVLNRGIDRVQRRDVRDHFIEDRHGETTYDVMSHVPFVVSIPEEAGPTVDAQCRQIDIYPTLLDLTDVDYEDAIDGSSLVPPSEIEDRDAYIRACGASLRGDANWHRAIRSNGYKYVTYPNRDWSDELYDLRDDPCELRPVEDPDRSVALARKLPRQSLYDRDTVGIDERLEDLGYR